MSIIFIIKFPIANIRVRESGSRIKNDGKNLQDNKTDTRWVFPVLYTLTFPDVTPKFLSIHTLAVIFTHIPETKRKLLSSGNKFSNVYSPADSFYGNNDRQWIKRVYCGTIATFNQSIWSSAVRTRGFYIYIPGSSEMQFGPKTILRQ